MGAVSEMGASCGLDQSCAELPVNRHCAEGCPVARLKVDGSPAEAHPVAGTDEDDPFKGPAFQELIGVGGDAP